MRVCVFARARTRVNVCACVFACVFACVRACARVNVCACERVNVRVFVGMCVTYLPYVVGCHHSGKFFGTDPSVLTTHKTTTTTVASMVVLMGGGDSNGGGIGDCYIHTAAADYSNVSCQLIPCPCHTL